MFISRCWSLKASSQFWRFRYVLAVHKKTESLIPQGFPNKKPPLFRQKKFETRVVFKSKPHLKRCFPSKNGINSAPVTTILEHIVGKKDSAKEKSFLDIHLKFGDPYGAFLIGRIPSSASIVQNGRSKGKNVEPEWIRLCEI